MLNPETHLNAKRRQTIAPSKDQLAKKQSKDRLWRTCLSLTVADLILDFDVKDSSCRKKICKKPYLQNRDGRNTASRWPSNL